MSKLAKILKSASTPRPWFKMNALEDTTEIYIYDQIGMDWWGDGTDPRAFIDALNEIDTPNISLHVNSPGGFIYDGFAIYNAINRIEQEVTAHVDGIAASIASVIVMAADKIQIAENADIMIHDPWSIVMGSSDDMRKEAGELDALKESIIGIYEARTGQDRAKLSELMSEESWLTGQAAIDLGFADELVENKKAAACVFDLSLFDNAPTHAVALQKRDLERSLRDAGYSRSDSAKIAAGPQSDSVEPDDNDTADMTEITTLLETQLKGLTNG